MKIEIKSRKEIERTALTPFPDNTALISISDFDCPFASLKNKPDFLLQSAFDDVPMADISDGAIVGSAIIKLLEKYGKDAPKYVGEYVKSMKDAMR